MVRRDVMNQFEVARHGLTALTRAKRGHGQVTSDCESSLQPNNYRVFENTNDLNALMG